jgi:cohesin loading factor subunit SCC2
MDHPSETFINQLESDLMKLIKNSQMAIIQSALACMSASVSKQKRSPKLVLQHFGALLSKFYEIFFDRNLIS